MVITFIDEAAVLTHAQQLALLAALAPTAPPDGVYTPPPSVSDEDNDDIRR